MSLFQQEGRCFDPHAETEFMDTVVIEITIAKIIYIAPKLILAIVGGSEQTCFQVPLKICTGLNCSKERLRYALLPDCVRKRSTSDVSDVDDRSRARFGTDEVGQGTTYTR